MRITGRPASGFLARTGLLGLAALCAAPGFAAIDPGLANFRHYGAEHGLSQNTIRTLYQDETGFLWIGTQDGLNRFDGYEFVTYRYDPGSERSLPDNHVTALAGDGEGRLWIGTYSGGVAVFDRGTERFARIGRDDAPGEPPVRVTALERTRDGAVWVAGAEGLGRIGEDAGSLRFTPLPAALAPLAGQYVADLAEDGDGNLWIATRGLGLWRYEPATAALYAVEIRAPGGAGFDRVQSIAFAADGSLWAGSDGPSLARLRPGEPTLVLDLPGGAESPVRIRDLLPDGLGNLWIASIGGGLLRLDTAAQRFHRYVSDPSSPNRLSDTDSYSLLLDDSGVLWIGTLSGGLNNLGLFSGGFEHYWAGSEPDGRLSHDMVTAFADDGAGIWVGTDGGGLNRFSPGTGRFSVYRRDPARPDSLANDRVWSLLVDREGYLWAGTWGGGLNRKAPGSATFERILPVTGEPPDIVTALAEDRRGDVWIGTRGDGLFRWIRRSGEMHEVPAALSGGRTLRRSLISDLEVSADGSLWIGTWDQGLVRLMDDERLQSWRHYPGESGSLASDTVRAIVETPDGIVWLGTAAGLSRLDPASGSVRNFSAGNGLPEGVIYAVVPDDAGQIWISSNRGVARFDPATERARTYGPRDGLQGYEFNGAASLRDSRGYIYFGGVNGFNRFLPDNLSDNPYPPTVALTGFLLFNEPQQPATVDPDSPLPAALRRTERIVLDHTQDVIAFQFSALHFVSPEQNRYAYRLEGFDRDWIHTDASRRLAAYTNLDPGDYVLRVKAANSDGLWSVEDATMRLQVLAPWWQTRPAWFAYLVIAALAVSALIRWRTLALRHRAAELQRIVRERTRQISRQKDTIEEQARKVEEVLHSKEQLFARVSHEFRTPLTLILGGAERLRGGIGADQLAATRATINRSARRLLRLVDQLLGLARLAEPESAKREPQPLRPLAAVAVASFESLASSRQLELTSDLRTDGWVEATPESLEQIILNLLSNALKYTPAGGRVGVTLDAEDGQVVLRVEDTGIGIDPALHERIFEPFERGAAKDTGSGIGLALVRELIDDLGGSIAVASTPGEGSVFEVRLPACAPAAGAAASGTIGERVSVERAVTAEALDAGPEPVARPPGEPDAEQVLIVEDHAELRRYLLDVLGDQFRVTAAADGESALATARSDIPDLVISDVMMPGMDGFEFCQQMKRDERTSHIPVILLTAREDRASLLQGLEEGADEYLTKPFDAEALRLRVRNLLETRQMLRTRLANALDRRAPVGQGGQGTAGGEAALGSRDRAFLDRLGEFLLGRYAEPDLAVADIAAALGMSERQLQRKLKALIDRNPSEHLRIFRLRRAADRLARGEPVGNVAHDVGFSSQSHFGACFKALYGVTPGEYRDGSTR